MVVFLTAYPPINSTFCPYMQRQLVTTTMGTCTMLYVKKTNILVILRYGKMKRHDGCSFHTTTQRFVSFYVNFFFVYLRRYFERAC